MIKKEKREQKKQDRGIVDFMMVTNHFFHHLKEWIGEMGDPRNPSYITYTQADFGYMAILKNVFGQYTMREMDENFNQQNCIDTLRFMSENPKLEEMPHYDTLNYYLEKLSPECLAALRKKMVTSLIRGKQFNRNRLLGKYWRIILDGTGLFYFKEKHCDNCLCTTRKQEDGKTVKQYYHKVLEAKLVLSNDFVTSIGTEFIENEKEDVSKQDCELNAAKRLLQKIKKDYPKLPILIQGDAPYACVLSHKNHKMRIQDEKIKFIPHRCSFVYPFDKRITFYYNQCYITLIIIRRCMKCRPRQKLQEV